MPRSVARDFRAGDEALQRLGGGLAARPGLAVAALTRLRALGRVDAFEADARAAELECVAVDDAHWPAKSAKRRCFT